MYNVSTAAAFLTQAILGSNTLDFSIYRRR